MSFVLQVNTEAAEVLYSAVSECCADTEEGATILDVCCGTGSIGICVASQRPANSDATVLGIEMCKGAVEDAKANAQTNGIANAAFVCSKGKSPCPSAGWASDVVRALTWRLLVLLAAEDVLLGALESSSTRSDDAVSSEYPTLTLLWLPLTPAFGPSRTPAGLGSLLSSCDVALVSSLTSWQRACTLCSPPIALYWRSSTLLATASTSTASSACLSLALTPLFLTPSS